MGESHTILDIATHNIITDTSSSYDSWHKGTIPHVNKLGYICLSLGWCGHTVYTWWVKSIIASRNQAWQWYWTRITKTAQPLRGGLLVGSILHAFDDCQTQRPLNSISTCQKIPYISELYPNDPVRAHLLSNSQENSIFPTVHISYKPSSVPRLYCPKSEIRPMLTLWI